MMHKCITFHFETRQFYWPDASSFASSQEASSSWCWAVHKIKRITPFFLLNFKYSDLCAACKFQLRVRLVPSLIMHARIPTTGTSIEIQRTCTSAPLRACRHDCMILLWQYIWTKRKNEDMGIGIKKRAHISASSNWAMQSPASEALL